MKKVALVAFFLIIVGSIVAWKMHNVDREWKSAWKCTMGLKALGAALCLYSADYDGYTPRVESWKVGVWPYIEAKSARVWNNLRFRSASEVQIAQALDRAGVLFLPNCKARLGLPESRRNREADFLVGYEGKWGILEVDGEPFHPPSRTAEDHERDRLFHDHGILVVEHFDANKCYENPDDVVRRFLEILKKA